MSSVGRAGHVFSGTRAMLCAIPLKLHSLGLFGVALAVPGTRMQVVHAEQKPAIAPLSAALQHEPVKFVFFSCFAAH
jgi:hypothetical protein